MPGDRTNYRQEVSMRGTCIKRKGAIIIYNPMGNSMRVRGN